MIFHRGRDLSLRRTFLLASDILALLCSLVLAALWRLGPQAGWDYLETHRLSLAASCGVFLVVFYASGMYERAALVRKAHSYRLPMVAVTISAAIIVVIFYAQAQFQIGRGILLLASVFVFFITWTTRHLYGMAVGHGYLSKKALLIGEGRDAEKALRLIKQTADSGFKVMGVVASKRMAPGSFLQDVPVVGNTEKLRELADAFDVETLIVATSLSREPAVLRMLRPLRCSGIEVMDYVTLYEMLAQEIPLDHINDEWLMNAALNGSVIHVRKIKRVMDFVIALIGLIIATPICLVTAIVVRMDSPGPILYRQRRSGIDGHPYQLFKFRTMRRDAEAATGAVWSTSNDSRITRVGHYLRKWRIDEIPQLLNVLKGEMSLVGPRPERPEFVETLSQAIPFYRERLMVPPGVTGWAQVKFPYASDVDGARRKLQFDIYYIKHMGFFLDCMILLRTVKTVLVGLRHHDPVVPHPEQRGEVTELPIPQHPADGAKTA
ncbi:MAG TPA: sugar transferase [Kiritimatiellia bacterium]|nr:sugar transferase [Kiritimatiellia bacterium]